MDKFNDPDSEIQTLDEQRQLRNLANAIAFADSFSLLFVRCNQRSRQREIIGELKARLSDSNIKVIFLEHQIEHLLDELQTRLGDEKPDAVFVYGLESSFPKADEAAHSPFVVTLNHARNSFKKILDCPLVLFLPEYAVSAIQHGATDFYSIRSGVYLFSAKAEETEQLISKYSSQEFKELEGLLFEEKRNRIETIKKLLSESESLPKSQRNLKREYKLKEKLADLYAISDEKIKATELYKEVVSYARKNEDFIFLSDSLSRLAMILHEQKNYQEAIELYNEALSIDEEIWGIKHSDYGSNLNNLGTIYRDLQDYDKALRFFTVALEIAEENFGVKSHEYLMCINNIAAINYAQGKYVEAVALYKNALQIDEDIFNTEHPSYALRLINLAIIYNNLNNYDEAIHLAKKAYRIRLKTLGSNHPDTKLIKDFIEGIQTQPKEKASLIVPYKK